MSMATTSVITHCFASSAEVEKSPTRARSTSELRVLHLLRDGLTGGH